MWDTKGFPFEARTSNLRCTISKTYVIFPTGTTPIVPKNDMKKPIENQNKKMTRNNHNRSQSNWLDLKNCSKTKTDNFPVEEIYSFEDKNKRTKY